MHRHGIPDCVLREEGDRLAFFEAILSHKSGREVCCCFFDFTPVEFLFCGGIVVAPEVFFGIAVDG